MHHPSSHANYRYHVLNVGKMDFCNGCLANRIFLSLLLPVYMILLMGPSVWLISALVVYMGFSITQFAVMARTGNLWLMRTSAVVTTLYLVGSHLLLLFGPVFSLPAMLLAAMMVLLSIPQITAYIWKIRTGKEFVWPRLKLMIRLGFVHAYLAAVLLTRNNLWIGGTLILTCATLFIVLRTAASGKVGRAMRALAVAGAASMSSPSPWDSPSGGSPRPLSEQGDGFGGPTPWQGEGQYPNQGPYQGQNRREEDAGCFNTCCCCYCLGEACCALGSVMG